MFPWKRGTCNLPLERDKLRSGAEPAISMATTHFGGQTILASGRCSAEYLHWRDSTILWPQSLGSGCECGMLLQGLQESSFWVLPAPGLCVSTLVLASSPKTCLCLPLLVCSDEHPLSLLTLLMLTQKVFFPSCPAFLFRLLPRRLNPTASSSPALECPARPSRMGRQLKPRLL